eukprot:366172-Chlamydomonas_euryale.AAC.5
MPFCMLERVRPLQLEACSTPPHRQALPHKQVLLLPSRRRRAERFETSVERLLWLPIKHKPGAGGDTHRSALSGTALSTPKMSEDGEEAAEAWREDTRCEEAAEVWREDTRCEEAAEVWREDTKQAGQAARHGRRPLGGLGKLSCPYTERGAETNPTLYSSKI